MAACKPGARKRAAGGHVKGEGEHPPHGGHHMLIIIGMPAKKKKTDGGVVEGLGARQTMGKRARGGPPKRRADGGPSDDDDSGQKPGDWHTDEYRAADKVVNDKMDALRDGPYRESAMNHQAAEIAIDRRGRAAGLRDNTYPENQPEGYPAPPSFSEREGKRGGRASGGRTLDAREDECDPDGRDRVNEGEGYDERAHEVTIRRAGGGNVKFRTPSGSVSQGARQQAEGRGEAMPGGRFPIRNTADLSNAKHAFGRANDKPAVKRWIDKRARDLGEPPMGGE